MRKNRNKLKFGSFVKFRNYKRETIKRNTFCVEETVPGNPPEALIDSIIDKVGIIKNTNLYGKYILVKFDKNMYGVNLNVLQSVDIEKNDQLICNRVVRMLELSPGDRFIYGDDNSLWTLLFLDDDGYYVCRKHSDSSIDLKNKGYGYVDHICDFQATEKVRFVPPYEKYEKK